MAKNRALNVVEDQDDFVWVLHNLQKDTKGFAQLSAILKKMAGINLPLNDKNLSLMAGRLIAVLRKYNCSSYDEFIRVIYEGGNETLNEFLTRMTTNTTEFFREDAHFTLLKKLVPQLMAKKQPVNAIGPKELRIWCAACSSGQEAYSLGMTLLEMIPQRERWDIKILATDIDTEVLNTAMTGVYTEEEAKNIPAFLKMKYFSAVHEGNTKFFQVVPQLRKLVQFASFNLIQKIYPFQHKFDIIFCRNVFIYFERETTKEVVQKMIHELRPDGYLFLGHSESGMVKNEHVKVVSHSVYQRVLK